MLYSGIGNDTMQGGSGDDVFVLSGYGEKRISDLGGTDTLILEGVFSSQFTLGLGSLLIRIPGFGNEIHIDDFDPFDPSGSGSIEYFQFEDRTLSYAEVLGRGITLYGTPEIDTITGTNNGDTIYAYGSDDVVLAYDGNDHVYAGAGNDMIDAGGGVDHIEAGDGDDTIYAGDGGDGVLAGEGNDLIYGGDGGDSLYAEEGDDVIYAEDGNDLISGGAGNDMLYGGDGNDRLVGAEGADTLIGGAGNDSYSIDSDDVIVEAEGGGNDTVGASESYVLLEHFENLVLNGGGAFSGTGHNGDNLITGNNDSNQLFGLGGNDFLQGMGGDDVLDGGDGADILSGGSGDDVYLVSGDEDSIQEVEDALYFIEDENGETQAFRTSGGIDTVVATADYRLGFDLENLVLLDSGTGEAAVLGQGNTEQNVIQGNSADNVLTAYTLDGDIDNRDSSDLIFPEASDGVRERLSERAIHHLYKGYATLPEDIGVGADPIYIGPIEGDQLFGGAGNDTLLGDLDHDYLEGGEGDDLLFGFGGSDVLVGGEGDDTYVIDQGYRYTISFSNFSQFIYEDESGDELIENENEGIDTVLSNISFELGEHFENLTLVDSTATWEQDLAVYGNASLNGDFHWAAYGYGNSLNNRIEGNSNNNDLQGREGDDLLVDDLGDDTLDGGLGDDYMAGGRGNDEYHVESFGDRVLEAGTRGSDHGIDTVRSNISYVLGTNVEHLFLLGATGQEALDGTGNELDNNITGNDGDNVLIGLEGDDVIDGGRGADNMVGGTGDDLYRVDALLDTVFEEQGEGRDTVLSSVSFTLGDNFEDLYLLDENSDGAPVGHLQGIGNELENLIVGNSKDNLINGLGADDRLYGQDGNDDIQGGDGSDLLDGGNGNDILAGGAGNDIYYLDSYDDQVIEEADAGNDHVFENLEYYSMVENVEKNTVIGDYQDLDDRWNYWSVEGNSLDNHIIGNDGRNGLYGNDGDDNIDGRAGEDSIGGGTGNDVLFGGLDAVKTVEQELYLSANGELNEYWWEDYSAKPVWVTTNLLAENDDEIWGGDGDDWIDGGSGNDYLTGDSGNDYLYGGDDGLAVYGRIDEAIEAFARNSEGEDDGPLSMVFLSNNDWLDGGEGDDILDGGSGDDQLYGGDGSDTLYGGDDGPLNKSNNDHLDGGAGIDYMAGGSGDDSYVVTGFYVETTDIPVYSDCGNLIPDAVTRVWTTDTVSETADGGRDTVYSYADYTLTENVEILELAYGSDAKLGRGNSTDNTIYGNNADNRLEGMAGNDVIYGSGGDDVIDGGAGNDYLDGGYGSDIYNFTIGSGHDVVASSYGTGNDIVRIVQQIDSNQVTLGRHGSDVVIMLNETGETMRLSGWFSNPSQRIRQIKFCDATIWNETTISTLANANPIATSVDAVNDAISVQEDLVTTTTGNALDNDTSVPAGLRVESPGIYQGTYGVLQIAADGSYTYTLDNVRAQRIAEGETYNEYFSYEAVNALNVRDTAWIDIFIAGQNDAPTMGPADFAAIVEDGAGEVWASDSLLSNGGFESGDLQGWILYQSQAYAGVYYVDDDNGYGAYFGSDNLLAQEVETEEGELYQLEFYLKGGGALDTDFSVTWNGEVLTSLSNVVLGEYTRYQFDVAGADGISNLEFNFDNLPGFWNLDNVSLTEIQTDPDVQVANGEIEFMDVDESDYHSLSVTERYSGYLGYLNVDLSDSAWTTDGLGAVDWNYVVDNYELQHLAAGVVLQQYYDISIDDGHGGVATQTVTITVTGVNDAPEAESDFNLVDEDGELVATGNVLENDFDIDDGDILTLVTSATYQGIYGQLILLEDGSYTYALNNDSALVQSLGQDEEVWESFAYAVTDGTSQTAAWLDVWVIGRNDAPVGVDDSGLVEEDGGTIVEGNALSNDSDQDAGAQLVVANAGIFQGVYGTLYLDDDGSYIYELDNYSDAVQSLRDGDIVSEQFAYELSDGYELTQASIKIDIAGRNDAPELPNLEAQVQEDGVLEAQGNVLSDSYDIDASSLIGVLDPGTYEGTYGTLVLESDGSYRYLLDNESGTVQALAAGQAVTETFSYSGTDGLETVAAELVISIAGANDAPIALIDRAEVQEDGVISITGNVLKNDLDIDEGAVLSVAQPGTYVGAYGTLILNADGSYVYQLDNQSAKVQGLAEGQVVSDQFVYQANDGIAQTASVLKISITGSNDVPIVQDDGNSLDEDAVALTSNVLFNDSDIDGGHGAVLSAPGAAAVQSGTGLRALIPGVYQGAYGSLALSSSGQYTYTLAENAQALQEGDSVVEVFNYSATDGMATTGGQISITVLGRNDGPVAVQDTGFAQEDGGSVLLTAAALLANDTDVDAGDTKTILSVGSSAAGASVTLTEAGVTYAPLGLFQSLAQGSTTTDSFTYTMVDSAGATSTTTVLMTIAGANDAPILVKSVADQSATAGQAVTFGIPADTFSDIDIGDVLSYSAALADGSALPSWLSFDAATRTFTGTPPGGAQEDCEETETSTVEIRITATDKVGASASDVFAVNITGTGTGGGAGENEPPKLIVGTDKNDTLVGTDKKDVLVGLLGYDKMSGGKGNDIYYVDETCISSGKYGTENKVDEVIELADQGKDAVYSTASYTLPTHVEELHLLGCENINAYGNQLSNILVGNTGKNSLFGKAGDDLLMDAAGNDTLDGGDGNDILDGGKGNDILIGGKGRDLYVYGLGGGKDVIREGGSAGEVDELRFGDGVLTKNVQVSKDGGDLVLQVQGASSGSVTIEDWFDSASRRVEQVRFADGTVWNEATLRSRAGKPQAGDCNESRNSYRHGDCDDDEGDRDYSKSSYCGDRDDDDCRDDAKQCSDMDAIAAELDKDPGYDFTALTTYLDRQGQSCGCSMSASQVANQWLTIQRQVAQLADDAACDQDDRCGAGGIDKDDSWCGDSSYGWGYSGSTGKSGCTQGFDKFSGLDEGFRRI